MMLLKPKKIKWQEQATRQTKVPTSNPASPKVQTQGATDGLSFEQMLEEAAKKESTLSTSPKSAFRSYNNI